MFELSQLLQATRGRICSVTPCVTERTGAQSAPVLGISIDSRTLKKGEAFIAIKGKELDGHRFIRAALEKGASCIIREAGGARHHLAKNLTPVIEVRDTHAALADLANYQRRRYPVPVIAVTGSNGKTTCKDMISWVLSKHLRVLRNEGTKNNQIGLPLTLLKLNKEHQVAVLELGTSHFGEIASLAAVCEPTIAVITNIGPSHLEYFKNLAGVLREKWSLIRRLFPPGIALLNADDDLLRPRLADTDARQLLIGVGIRYRSDFYASQLTRTNTGIRFAINGCGEYRLKTAGLHNVYNALYAVALGRLFGMERIHIAGRLAEFDFPRGRLQISRRKGVTFIDDTYNSNPLSLAQALDTLAQVESAGRKIFVMGDMLELGRGEGAFHAEAGLSAAGVCDVLITVGRRARRSADAARSRGLKGRQLLCCATSRQAQAVLCATVRPRTGDVVLVKGSRGMKMEEVLR